MTLIDKIKDAVGLGHGHDAPTGRMEPLSHLNASPEANYDPYAAATAEQMSAARLPMAYRDSCANLLIPLNRCRQEEYYLPWKCEV